MFRDPGLRADLRKFRAIIRRRVRLALVVICACVLAVAGVLVRTIESNSSQAGAAPRLHVSGNQLVSSTGQRVVLHGVNRSGGEYSCVHGTGIWDGPMNQASVSAMKKWNVNAVRVPLNEACWNGQAYVPRRCRAAAYQQAVEAYVRLLNRNGMVAILDLHWSDGAYSGPAASCSSARALCEKPMPDAAQSIPFWRSVASAFRDNDAVIFDVFNEPFPEVTGNETAAWICWLSGGNACPGLSYKAAGMQALVNVIRSTGARNVILVSGILFANDLSQWLRYEPTDPDHNLAASWHAYNFKPLRVTRVLAAPDRSADREGTADRGRDRREQLL